jgi:NADH-quinone oxidoreductase subunit A
MHLEDIYPAPLWPFPVYTVCVLGIVAVMLALSHVLGERHRGRATAEPYECGVVPTGGARLRYHIQFYLIGVLFVVFDIEAVFIVAWAVAVRELGWEGYAKIVLFIGVLCAALFYLVRCGALDWRKGTAAPGADARKEAQ